MIPSAAIAVAYELGASETCCTTLKISVIARSGIAKKFYRDHLNHMLRVMLLANAIGNKMNVFSLDKKDLRMLTIAALVHDVAYSLGESYIIINETTKALKRCYVGMRFPDYEISYNEEKVKKLINLLKSEDDYSSIFDSMLKEHNHGLLGGIEFVDFIKEEALSKNKRLLEAIVFHDGSSEVPENLKTDPILLALILSDEIQDWGRPVGLDKESAMSHLSDFSISTNSIIGSFAWRKNVQVSPLRQVYAKKANFNRFKYPDNLKVVLNFCLPNYKEFKIVYFEKICSKLLEFCETKKPECIENLNVLWKDSNEWFKTFYGTALPKTNDIVDYWKKSIGITGSVYFSPIDKEILYIDKETELPRSLQLEIQGNCIKMTLSGQETKVLGYLCSQKDDQTMENATRLVTSLMIFQGLASRIASQGVGLSSKFVFPSKKLIRGAMELVGCERWTDDMTDEVNALRRSVSEKGYFSFEVKK